LSTPDNHFISEPARQIVCISSTRWGFLWQRPQQIMSRLSKQYEVLYVNPPFPVSAREIGWNDFSESCTYEVCLGNRLETVSDSLRVFTPLEISAASYPELDRCELRSLNVPLLKAQLDKLLSFFRPELRLIWVYDPLAASLLEQYEKQNLLYDCIDSFRAFSWSYPHIDEAEQKLVTMADVVLVSAQALYDQKSRFNPAVYLVPNAADFDHFARCGSFAGETDEYKNITHPRLGFVGAIYEWIDFGLIDYLAARNPEWNIVLIGPKQHGLAVPERPNIHWLGIKDYALLPFYLQGLDVMLIPFLKNEITESANPIKMWEYLAAGKPVVSTDIPEVQAFPNSVWIGRDHEEFSRHCATVIRLVQDANGARRISEQARAIARSNTWDNRCEAIREILKKHFQT